MVRVLVGGFGGVARCGIRAILREPDVVIDECAVEAVMSEIDATLPDVLVIDSGAFGFDRLARVARANPAMTVVVCSADDDVLRTYPRFAGRCSSQRLSAAALLESVRSR